ncbi:hypothetical protein IFO70_32685 [Phormidium tenue FACHB-886]|nr:hypothetical protein [Phormidium tenue FACHB-886]
MAESALDFMEVASTFKLGSLAALRAIHQHQLLVYKNTAKSGVEREAYLVVGDRAIALPNFAAPYLMPRFGTPSFVDGAIKANPDRQKAPAA